MAQAFRFAGARRRAVVCAKAPGTVLPIVIHAAKAEEVRAILAWLKREDVLDHVWLSFDDGWREFKETVRVLEVFEKPATLFVAPGETMRGDVWTNGLTVPERQRLYQLDEQSRYNEIALLNDCGPRGARSLPAGKSPAAGKVGPAVPAGRNEAALQGECTLPVRKVGPAVPAGRNETPLLGEREIREVAKHPLVRIGNHTWSHLSCPHRPKEEVLNEIDRAQETLTEWCGYAPTDFAYPFGRGTPELDEEIRRRGMTPHYTRQGLVTKETLGAARNMVYEGMSLAENLGRILMAWPKVGVTL